MSFWLARPAEALPAVGGWAIIELRTLRATAIWRGDVLLWKLLGVLILLAVPLAWGLSVDMLFHRIGRRRANRKATGATDE